MGLTNKKEEQLKRMPLIETRLRKSKDEKFVIHQTVITHIRPVSYYRAVLSGESVDEPELAEA